MGERGQDLEGGRGRLCVSVCNRVSVFEAAVHIMCVYNRVSVFEAAVHIMCVYNRVSVFEAAVHIMCRATVQPQVSPAQSSPTTHSTWRR